MSESGATLRSFVRRVPLLILLAAIATLAAELTARADDLVRWGTPLSAVPEHERDLVLHDSLAIRGKPNGRHKRWHLNSYGFRNGAMTEHPRPGCTRIMVLGASETLGLYEADGKEYPAQLGDSLRTTGCYEVINAAVAGLNLRGIEQLWTNWASRFDPHIVLIYPSPAFYLGDDPPKYVEPPRGGPPAAPPWWMPRLLDRAKDRFEIPAAIQRRRVQRSIEASLRDRPASWVFEDVPPDRLEQFRDDLTRLVWSVRAKGAEPVIVTHAMRFSVPPHAEDADLLAAWRSFSPRATTETMLRFELAASEVARALGREQNVMVIDLARSMNGSRALFADFSHFTDSGAAVAASLIKRDLMLRMGIEPIRPAKGARF